MREGSYTWPDDNNVFELRYDWEAIQWLLDNVHGNPVILESVGGRLLSRLGHARRQHDRAERAQGHARAGAALPGGLVGYRDGLHREFWSTPDVERTQQIIDELGVALIYVGQLER